MEPNVQETVARGGASRAKRVLGMVAISVAVLYWWRVDLVANLRVFRSWLGEISDTQFQARWDRLQGISTVTTDDVPFLLELINDHPSWRLKKAAVMKLASWRDPAVVGLLSDILRNQPVWRARTRAAEGLGDTGDPRAIPALLHGMHDEDYEVRARCATSLGRLRAVDALPQLAALLRDPDPQPRHSAVEAIGILDREGRYISEVLACTRDEDSEVRRYAVEALARLRRTEAVPRVLELLKDADPLVRVEACRALGALGNSSCLDALRACGTDPDSAVCFAAKRAETSIMKAGGGASKPMDASAPR